MSHPEQRGFFKAVVDANKSLLSGANVLEIGSRDVNGSVRTLFQAATNYVGVDLQEGPAPVPAMRLLWSVSTALAATPPR